VETTRERPTACPICWMSHADGRHRILAVVEHHDQGALFAALARLRVPVPDRFDITNEGQAAYALLAMEDEAERRGLRVVELGDRYVVAADTSNDAARAA